MFLDGTVVCLVPNNFVFLSAVGRQTGRPGVIASEIYSGEQSRKAIVGGNISVWFV